jgi:oxygen-independent coproporphyrinogen-3 oxidase
MVDTLCRELELVKNDLDFEGISTIETIYFGGGTPSILNKKELRKLLDSIHSKYQVNPSAEITLEANPDDISSERVHEWKELGINRLSIGIQSFRESDLRWMNRAHSVEEALNCIRIAQEAGISNLSVDLIYGLPDLTLNEWMEHVNKVIDLGIQHVSAYCLTVEEKTSLHHWVSQQKIRPASDDEQHDQFLALVDNMERNGYEQYEISNFAQPGFRAVHNSNYWKRISYIGIGPSAHSFNQQKRRWNVANNRAYMKAIHEDEAWYEIEQLDNRETWNELLLTGLRTMEGVALNEVLHWDSFTDEDEQQLASFTEQGWLIQTNERIALTKQGRLMADHIASSLFH